MSEIYGLLTRDQLEKQKGIIVSEFNYHLVRDFCDALLQADAFRHYKILEYNSIAAIRGEHTAYLNKFIDGYLSERTYLTTYNSKWRIGVEVEVGSDVPYLSSEFAYSVTEYTGTEY